MNRNVICSTCVKGKRNNNVYEFDRKYDCKIGYNPKISSNTCKGYEKKECHVCNGKSEQIDNTSFGWIMWDGKEGNEIFYCPLCGQLLK